MCAERFKSSTVRIAGSDSRHASQGKEVLIATAALKAHATRVGADPSLWRFSTAPPDVVDRFASTFGVNVIREKDRTITHNLRTAVIDPDGRVASVYDGSDWTTTEVLDELRNTLTR